MWKLNDIVVLAILNLVQLILCKTDIVWSWKQVMFIFQNKQFFCKNDSPLTSLYC